MGRRRGRTTDLAGDIAKLVILGVLFIAITVGGVQNFNSVFTSLMRAVLFSIISVILIAGGIALAILFVKRRQGMAFPKTDQPAADPAPAPTEPTLSEKLRELDWFQFEKITEILMRARGYTVERRGGAKADGGIDLIARKATETIAIQCKHWQAWKVGVKTVREFLGAMTHAQIAKGIIVTMKGYTQEAEALAASHNIQLVNEAQYRELIFAAQAQADPEFLRALNDPVKYCPKCEAPMVLRRGYSQFWGCSRFPHCRYTLKLA